MGIDLSKDLSVISVKDIRELETKIDRFKTGDMDEERFRSYRLARGVYGQRQLGVHMFRIKVPFGKISTAQLEGMAHTSNKFATGNLHLTTRQNIQYHYVKLDDSPKVWNDLEAIGGVTGREACGNTVRTVTASAKAGVDPNELFDVSPYAHAVSYYFLRNPICQEMGRKFKMSFSSSNDDSAYNFMHDLGFFPEIQDGAKGFRVMIGGGLGAQAILARTVKTFLPADELIPFIESVIRVFDRHGEREKRHKARLKFLVEEKRGMGVEKFMALVDAEQTSLKNKTVSVDDQIFTDVSIPDTSGLEILDLSEDAQYEFWKATNVFEQKQKGYYAVQVKVPVGDIHYDKAIELAQGIKKYAADDIRITMNQGLLVRYVTPQALPHLYKVLLGLDLAEAGFDTIADVTTCPGTDTCNLGVTNSTDLAKVLEAKILADYKHLVLDDDVTIKMSGCMNACGQHMAANIGFHGSSIKNGALVIPAMQIVLGGGVSKEGEGFIADKVIKLPTKRIPDAISVILDDYEANATDGEYFMTYYQRQGKKYFYEILKPLADLTTIVATDYHDWGQQENYVQAIGVGECAGVSVDVIGAIINDADEKFTQAQELLEEAHPADAIYRAYTACVVGAKALLLSEDVKCNTHIGIINDFDEHFVKAGRLDLGKSFGEYVLRLSDNEPTASFAADYVRDAAAFMAAVKDIRQKQIAADSNAIDKVVIESYYKA